MSYGEILRNLRIQRGLSKRKLAALASISRDVVGYLENGSRIPSTKVLRSLFTVLAPTDHEKEAILRGVSLRANDRERERVEDGFSITVSGPRTQDLLEELTEKTINFSKMGATEASKGLIRAQLLEILSRHGIQLNGEKDERS